jgi:hypothetical protein
MLALTPAAVRPVLTAMHPLILGAIRQTEPSRRCDRMASREFVGLLGGARRHCRGANRQQQYAPAGDQELTTGGYIESATLFESFNHADLRIACGCALN